MKTTVKSFFCAVIFFCIAATSCTATKKYPPAQPQQQMYACHNYAKGIDAKGLCVENNKFLRSDQRDLIAILYEIKRDNIPLPWVYVDVKFEMMKVTVKVHDGNGKVCAQDSGETFEIVMQKVALMPWGECGDKSPPIVVPPTNPKHKVLYVHHSDQSGAVVLFL